MSFWGTLLGGVLGSFIGVNIGILISMGLRDYWEVHQMGVPPPQARRLDQLSHNPGTPKHG